MKKFCAIYLLHMNECESVRKRQKKIAWVPGVGSGDIGEMALRPGPPTRNICALPSRAGSPVVVSRVLRSDEAPPLGVVSYLSYKQYNGSLGSVSLNNMHVNR